MGSDSKSTSGGSKVHDYYGTIAGIVGEGVFDYLSAVQIDGKVVWPVARPWLSGENIALNELRHAGGRTWQCILAHNPSSAANVPSNPTYWEPYKLERGTDVLTNVTIENYGQMRIYWGTDAQNQDPKLASANNQYSEDHPDYRGICYVVLINFLFGRERNSAPNVTVTMGREPKQSIVTGASSELTDGQANVIATGAELLTSYNALALPDSGLDPTSFQDTADALADTAINCSALLDEQGSMRSWADILSEMSGAWLRFNPSTQLIEAGYWLRGTVPVSYHTVLVSHLTEKAELDGQGWDSAKTRAFVTYYDRSRLFKRSSDKFDDSRAYKVLGEHRSITIDRPFVARWGQAVKQAAEWLRSNGRPQLGGTISVRREHARNIRPGDYVLMDIDLEPGGSTLSQYFRVLSREIPFKGPISIVLDADETLAATFSDVTPDEGLDIDEAVDAIVNARIIEAPVSLSEFQADHVLALVERPHETISGFQIYFDTDTGGTFQIIGDSHGFCTRAVLRSDYSDSETGDMEITVPAQVDTDRLTENVSDLKASDDQLLAILVDVASGFVDEDSADYGIIEICSISAITLVSGDDYDLTVLRARQGTKQRGFVTGTAEVWIVPRSSLLSFTHAALPEIRRNRITGDTPATGFFRLAPYTANDSRDLANCSSIEFRMPKASTAGPELSLTAPPVDSDSEYLWPPDWDSGTAYVEDDWVFSGGTSYQCILGHTNQAPPNGTYWVVGTPYPVDIEFIGEWTDQNADMTAFQMWLEKDGVAGEVLDEDDSFSPIDSYPFEEEVHIAESGTWRVRIVATDAIGLKSERTITIEARDTNTQVAKPKFKSNGKRVKGEEWNLYGKIKLTCATPGSDIEYRLAIAEDRDWETGTVYALKDKRWNNGAIYTCYAGHTADAAKEPGVGGTWNTYWKTETATVAWANTTVYAVGDKVTHNGVGYFCWSAHTSVTANNEPGVASGWKNRWIYAHEVLSDVGWDGYGAWHAYDDDTEGFDTQPYGWQPTDDDHRQYIEARATKAAYTDSEVARLDIRFKRIGIGDDIP